MILTAEELYKEYYKKVYNYVYSRLRNHEEAEDVSSDIFLKIIEKLDTFDPEKASYSTWIYAITRNRVINHYRSFRQTEDIDDIIMADASESPLDAAILKMRAEILADGLEQLAERNRNILIARYYYYHSFREIGEILDITEANARVAHGRALKTLRELIGDRL